MDTMDSSGRRVSGELPVEIMERVLSFLSVPVLCRLRSVCKTWNELIGNSSFHDLCDRNGKNDAYLFLWREDWDSVRGAVAPGFTGTFSFLDLDAGRWYSIQATKLPRVSGCGNELETRLMAMDDGLVCELTTLQGTERNFALTLSDPVAKTRRTLPAPPKFYCEGDGIPHIVTVVDDVTRSYKVFLFNNLKDTALPRVYVHESFTNEWRGLRNLPNGMKGFWAESAVALGKSLFVAKSSSRAYEYDQLTLFSQKLDEDDSWAEVWRMSFRRTVEDPQLVVSDNRLFVIVWLDPDSWKLSPLPSHDCPNSESLFQTNLDYPDTLFEMYEILVSENGRKPILQLTYSDLQHIFGTDGDFSVESTYVFPCCFDTNGRCNSVVLVDHYTGQLRRYQLWTGSVDVLLPHPSSVQPSGVQPSPDDDDDDDDDDDGSEYQAKSMRLSLRNVLAQRSKTSMGCRVLH